MSNHKFACPTCSQRIAYDENAFGRKIRCPNCKSIITVPVPEGASPVVPPPTPAQTPGTPPPTPPGGKPAGPVASRPIPGNPAATGSAGEGANSKKKILIGAVVGVVVALAVGATVFLKGGDDASAPPANVASAGGGESPDPVDGPGKEPEANAAMEASMDGMTAEMAAAFGNEEPEDGATKPTSGPGPDFSWVPEDTEFFVAIRPAKILESPLIGQLIESQPNAGQSLAAFEQMAGVGIADIEGILVAVSGIDKLMAGGLNNVDPANPMAAQAAMMQAGQQMNEQQLLALNTAKPIDLEAIPMLAMAQPQPAEHAGKEYIKITPAPNAPPVAIFQANETTIVIGAESRVRKAIETGGKRGNSPAEFGLLQPDYHLALVLSPTGDSLAKMREGAAASSAGADELSGLLSRHMSGGGLALTSTKAGLGLQASMNGDDADAAKRIVAMMQSSIDKAPAQFEAMKSALPPGLQAAAADLVSSMTVSQLDQAAEFTAVVPNELFSEEGMGVLMGLAMTKMMEAGQSQTAMSETPKGETSMIPTSPSAPPSTAKVSDTAKAAEPAEPAMQKVEDPAVAAPVEPAQPAADAVAIVPAEATAVMPQEPGRMLRAWTMNVLNAGIPDEPVTGKVNNLEFRMDAALIENGVLILRKGSERSPTLQVEVHNIQRPGEALDGKKFELANVSGVNTPTVRMKWEDPKKLRMPMRLFDNSFAIKLEFGAMEEGKIPGKVFIAVPDGRKSYVTGAFEAEVF